MGLVVYGYRILSFLLLLLFFCLNQTLESILPKEYLAKVTPTSGADYRQMLQEWSKLRDINQQKISSGVAATAANAPAVSSGGIGQVSVDTSESSPGMSSVGNNDDVGAYLDARGICCYNLILTSLN